MTDFLDQLTEMDFEDDDFSGDQPEEVIEEVQNTLFVGMRLYKITHDPFVGGARFTIPGVFESEYDEATQTSTQLTSEKEFAGRILKKGDPPLKKPRKKYTFVTLHTNKDGDTYQKYQEMKTYRERCHCKGKDSSCVDCGGTGQQYSVWADYQWPVLKALGSGRRELLDAASKANRAWINGDHSNSIWAWCKVVQEEVPFVNKFIGRDGNEVAFSPRFYSEIQVYDNKEAWQTASNEYWAKRGSDDNGSGPVPKSDLPTAWTSDDMYNDLQESFDRFASKGYSHKKIAASLTMLDGDSNPMPKSDGTPCDAKAIMAALAGVDQSFLDWS